MNKIDYFIKALQRGSYRYKEWIIECFGIVHLPQKPESITLSKITFDDLKEDTSDQILNGMNDAEPTRFAFERYPMQLFMDDNLVVFLDPDTEEWTPLQGITLGKPFYNFKEEIALKKGDIANLDRPVTTWLGNLLVNQIVLVYPFGDRIPFQLGRISISKIENDLIVPRLESVPEDPKATRNPDKIYVDVLERFYYQAAYSITGWCQLAVPAATPYTIVTDPAIKKRRKELVEEFKDQLDDPIIVARIMKELSTMDKAWQAQDPEGGFLDPNDSKTFDVTRAKTYLMYGLEYDFNNRSKATLIERPLTEQWDITKLPEIANSIIDGSFSRGSMTALGGEAAKFITRFFLNCTITEEDCGSVLGVDVVITNDNIKGYRNAYLLENRKPVLLTPELIKGYIGKSVIMRSPMYCKTKNGNFCVTCIGKRFENSKTALASIATEVGNTLMLIMMKRMHGVALKLEAWDIESTLN